MESGARLVYISGNHDFWFGDFFRQYLQAEVYDRDFSLVADGKQLYFSHGDLFTFNDLRYKLFRRVIRTHLVKKVFSFLHPDLALSLGSSLSRSSSFRRLSSRKHRSRSYGLEMHAKKLIERKTADIVIMGHSHEPVLKQLSGGLYLNSGDWLRNYSYVKLIDGLPEICRFELQ